MKLYICFLISLFAALSACKFAPEPSSFSELKPTAADNAPYVIGVGDRLELKFFFVPEMNEIVQVRPDGKISVMFIHDVKAEGKTTEELRQILKKELVGHVRQPDLVVSVNSFGSQQVYIGGEVLKPGAVQLNGRTSLMRVLSQAGWVTPQGSTQKIVLLRRDKNNKEKVYHIDSDKIVSGEDTGQDIIVQAGDVIMVPPLSAVEVDRWVERNIRQALPFGMGATYSYTNYYNGAATSR